MCGNTGAFLRCGASFYDDFLQMSDEEVTELLDRASQHVNEQQYQD